MTWCEWVKNSLVHDYGIPTEKISIIPPGVDLEKWNFERHHTLESITENPLR